MLRSSLETGNRPSSSGDPPEEGGQTPHVRRWALRGALGFIAGLATAGRDYVDQRAALISYLSAEHVLPATHPQPAAIDRRARRVLFCVPGAWTETWYDYPAAWQPWCQAFLGWSAGEWDQFHDQWQRADLGERRRRSEETGLYFFDWRRVPGGSVHGSTRLAADSIAADLADLPADSDVTLLGHSKGGNVVTWILAERRTWESGAKPTRAILVDTPLDAPRQAAGQLLRLGIEQRRLSERYLRVPCATVNNWLDPAGGRSRGARNYQTLVWQDYLDPFPPHGLKRFLAERVLRDLGALPREST